MALIIAFPNFGLRTAINVVCKGRITCGEELMLKNKHQLYEQDFPGMRADFACRTTLQTFLTQRRLRAPLKELVLP